MYHRRSSYGSSAMYGCFDIGNPSNPGILDDLVFGGIYGSP
jgi:hypothetical protein